MDIGWSELLVIGVVALIVVGPKDLPVMFRTLGRYTAKIRKMAREFQRAMEDAADEAGVKETARDLKSMTSPSKLGLNKLNEAADKFDKWDPSKPSKATKPVGPETAKLAEERAEKARQTKESVKAMAKEWGDKHPIKDSPKSEPASETSDPDAPKTDTTA